MRRERNEEKKIAKSYYREYKMLMNRLHDNMPKVERDYCIKMINNTKSRINFSLLGGMVKPEDENAKYYV
jgi:hypothetical protein